ESGQDIADAIEHGDTLETLSIIRVGEEAKNWNAIEAFRSVEGAREKRIAEAKRQAEEALDKLAAGFQSTESGLRYQIIQKGDGVKAEKGKTVFVHYKGQLED